jgi:hypothetical protein
VERFKTGLPPLCFQFVGAVVALVETPGAASISGNCQNYKPAVRTGCDDISVLHKEKYPHEY